MDGRRESIVVFYGLFLLFASPTKKIVSLFKKFKKLVRKKFTLRLVIG